jgi:hypothetical protein
MRTLSLLVALLLIAGCSSDPVEPGPGTTDPEAWFDGSYDGDELVLQRTEVFGPGGVLIEIDLLARGMSFDPDVNQLKVAVSIRNSSRTDLYAPASIGLSEFNPSSIHPLNANNHQVEARRWWYDYSRQLGDDRILSAGEESAPVEWVLQLPGPGSFSFAATARFAGAPDRPVLGGRVFLDVDRDGLPGREEPAAFGTVEVTFPDARQLMVQPAEDGTWFVRVQDPGIHVARWISPPTLGFAPVCLTTPNPLQVMITRGADGLPSGFTDAHFGVDPEPCLQWRMMPIVLSNVPVDSLDSDPWTFLGLARTGPDDPGPERLEVTVGFSGCSADHPLAFAYERPGDEAGPADGTIPESRMVATIVHDDRGELCDAWFQVTRAVDLGVLRAQWRELTGYTGPISLELHTPQGIELFVID